MNVSKGTNYREERNTYASVMGETLRLQYRESPVFIRCTEQWRRRTIGTEDNGHGTMAVETRTKERRKQ